MFLMTFGFQDDANHDPQWSEEQLIANELKVGGITIGKDEVDFMSRTTLAVFEVLERAWASIDCALIDMKIEFGVADGEIMVADVIDSDSWRLWPSGDRRLMKDKQVYRDLKVVTAEALDQVKANFKWIAERLDLLMPAPKALVCSDMLLTYSLIRGHRKSKNDYLRICTHLFHRWLS
jgi:phosphoribosylaminoimidazole carboxylase/phosphoribosylaminoimidazole-succinocarboxamide synthase